MALPSLPSIGQNPWYVPRTNWDNAVSGELDARVKVNTLAVLAPAATGSDQTAALQTALSSAATFGLWLQLNGAHQIANQIIVPQGAKLDGRGGTITQTGTLKSGFRLNSVSNVRFKDLTLLGKTSDYVNSSAVYGATGIYISGTSSDVVVEDCRILGWAGNGVFITAASTDIHIRHNRITGAGPAYIVSTSYNYSAGVNADPGVAKIEIHDNDISGFSQGVVTGDNLVDWRITDNFIHDIPGQHGLYLETMTGGVISNNIIHDCALLGMKIQIGTNGATDATDIVISDNVFRNCGAQAILLDNPQLYSTRFRRINITGNQIFSAAGGGIEARYAVGLNISDNAIYNSKWGIRVTQSSLVTISDGLLSTLTHSALFLSDCQDIVVNGTRIKDPASALSATDRYGVYIEGASSADITIKDVKITDASANMRYGVYVAAGTSSTMSFDSVVSSGAADYGWRLLTPGSVKLMRACSFAGALGAFLNRPTNYTPIPDATNATDVITQLNALLAVHRAQGDIPA